MLLQTQRDIFLTLGCIQVAQKVDTKSTNVVKVILMTAYPTSLQRA